MLRFWGILVSWGQNSGYIGVPLPPPPPAWPDWPMLKPFSQNRGCVIIAGTELNILCRKVLTKKFHLNNNTIGCCRKIQTLECLQIRYPLVLKRLIERQEKCLQPTKNKYICFGYNSTVLLKRILKGRIKRGEGVKRSFISASCHKFPALVVNTTSARH